MVVIISSVHRTLLFPSSIVLNYKPIPNKQLIPVSVLSDNTYISECTTYALPTMYCCISKLAFKN